MKKLMLLSAMTLLTSGLPLPAQESGNSGPSGGGTGNSGGATANSSGGNGVFTGGKNTAGGSASSSTTNTAPSGEFHPPPTSASQ